MKSNRVKRYVISAILCVVCIVGIVYVYASIMHQSRFFRHTTINGINVSNMSAQEAEAKIKAQLSAKSVALQFKDGRREVVNLAKVDCEYKFYDSIQKAMDKQKPFLWPKEYFENTNLTTEFKVYLNEEKFKKLVNKFPELDKDKMKYPKNASIVVKDKQFVIEAEKEGNSLKAKNVVSATIGELEKGRKIINLGNIEGVYDKPEVLADDEKLLDELEALKKLESTSIVYKLPSKKKVLDLNTFIKWISRDKKGYYVFDKEVWRKNIKEYVAATEKEVNNMYKPHRFKTKSGSVITIPGTGYYGWVIDEEKEAKQLEKDLEKGVEITRKPIYSKEEVAPDNKKNNYGFGKSYVEINLTKQHLWIFKKGKKVFDTAVVSGKNDPKHKTPAGAFVAFDKRRNKMMRGERRNGKYEYETLAKYWIRLNNNGVGLHDAPWRGKFGGDIWKKNGSHGCVNLPAAAAVKIYDIVPNGMPIAVYY